MADPRQYGQYGQGSGYPSQSSPNPPPPQQSYEERNYRWFVSGDGIRRDVITADIQRYLGPDALVKPGHDHNGREGYWIAAYRTLTQSMVQDLRTDSANFEHSNSRGNYSDSTIHRSRQHWGPTDSPVASAPAPQPSRQQPQYQQQAYSAPQASGYQPAMAGQQTGYGTSQYGQGYTGQPNQSGYPTPQPSVGSSASPASEYSGSYTTQPPNHRAAPTYGSTQQGAYYTPSNEAPRGQAPLQAAYTHPQQAEPQPHSTTQQPAASTTARPGYYLASDGRYYPNSSLR